MSTVRLKLISLLIMSEKRNTSKIIKKKKITMETKLDILRRFDKGEKAVNIAKALNLAATTVRTIQVRDKNKIKEAAKSATLSETKTMTRTRSGLMIKMESLLSIWIQDQISQKIPLSKMVIQAKAKSLFEDIKTKALCSDSASGSATVKEDHFEASHGWFERFKARANLHNIVMKGEAASADTDAASTFKTNLKSIVAGYSPKQVFNVDETGLFWKRLPKRTYISKTEKSAPGFKASKDRLTLLLGGNAYGDFKFKPLLIYNSENPRALKGCEKNRLPVYWRSNKKAWMTAALFKDWFFNCAIPEVKLYLNKENLDFKALILIDNAPSHPVYIDDISPNVKFVFLPPNTTALIQPMDQGVISCFKSYYLRRTFKLLLSTIEGPAKPTMQGFWKKFNISDAIQIIADSWAEVKPSCMNGTWRNIWPECVQKETGSNTAIKATYDSVDNVFKEIATLAKEANLEGLEECDLEELMNSDGRELTNEDLLEFREEMSDEDDSVTEIVVDSSLTSQHLSKAMNLIDEALDILLKNDPDNERSLKVSYAVTSDITCYKQLYHEMKNKSIQPTLEKFFKKTTMIPVNSQISTDSE